MLALFDELAEQSAPLSAEALIGRLGYTRGTGYRYIKKLTDRGFLRRSSAGFSLGPRIAELDFVMRQGDPVLDLCCPVIRQLSLDVDAHALLAQFFDDRIIVIHLEEGSEPIRMSYGRGRRMPLFAGSTSKALLGSLPIARQRRIYRDHGSEAAAAGWGQDWAGFKDILSGFEKARVVSSFGELDRDNVGLSVPARAFDPLQPLAITLVLTDRRFAVADQAEIGRQLRGAAAQISDAMRGAAGLYRENGSGD